MGASNDWKMIALPLPVVTLVQSFVSYKDRLAYYIAVCADIENDNIAIPTIKYMEQICKPTSAELDAWILDTPSRRHDDETLSYLPSSSLIRSPMRLEPTVDRQISIYDHLQLLRLVLRDRDFMALRVQKICLVDFIEYHQHQLNNDSHAARIIEEILMYVDEFPAEDLAQSYLLLAALNDKENHGNDGISRIRRLLDKFPFSSAKYPSSTLSDLLVAAANIGHIDMVHGLLQLPSHLNTIVAVAATGMQPNSDNHVIQEAIEEATITTAQHRHRFAVEDLITSDQLTDKSAIIMGALISACTRGNMDAVNALLPHYIPSLFVAGGQHKQYVALLRSAFINHHLDIAKMLLQHDPRGQLVHLDKLVDDIQKEMERGMTRSYRLKILLEANDNAEDAPTPLMWNFGALKQALQQEDADFARFLLDCIAWSREELSEALEIVTYNKNHHFIDQISFMLPVENQGSCPTPTASTEQTLINPHQQSLIMNTEDKSGELLDRESCIEKLEEIVESLEDEQTKTNQLVTSSEQQLIAVTMEDPVTITLSNMLRVVDQMDIGALTTKDEDDGKDSKSVENSEEDHIKIDTRIIQTQTESTNHPITEDLDVIVAKWRTSTEPTGDLGFKQSTPYPFDTTTITPATVPSTLPPQLLHLVNSVEVQNRSQSHHGEWEIVSSNKSGLSAVLDDDVKVENVVENNLSIDSPGERALEISNSDEITKVVTLAAETLVDSSVSETEQSRTMAATTASSETPHQDTPTGTDHKFCAAAPPTEQQQQEEQNTWTPMYHIGQDVESNFLELGKFHAGRIVAINATDRTYDIEFHAFEETEDHVSESLIRHITNVKRSSTRSTRQSSTPLAIMRPPSARKERTAAGDHLSQPEATSAVKIPGVDGDQMHRAVRSLSKSTERPFLSSSESAVDSSSSTRRAQRCATSDRPSTRVGPTQRSTKSTTKISWREMEEWKNVDQILTRKRRFVYVHGGRMESTKVPWGEEFAAIQSLKRFAAQYPAVLRDHIEMQLHQVGTCSSSKPQSTVQTAAARDALLLIKDLSFLLKHRLEPFLDVILPTVLPAVFHAQKRFLCETTYDVLEALVLHCSGRKLAKLLLEYGATYAKQDDLRLLNLTSVYTEKCFLNMQACEIEALATKGSAGPVLVALAKLLESKVAPSRIAAQKSWLHIQKELGHDRFERLVISRLSSDAAVVVLQQCTDQTGRSPRKQYALSAPIPVTTTNSCSSSNGQTGGSISILQRMLLQRQNRVTPLHPSK